MNELETFIGPKDRPTQIFNGKIYQLYPGEKYFSSSFQNRLHVDVWTHYMGKPPKGYHVHHKDGNKQNNNIDNLELKKGNEHISEHMRKWLSEDPDHFMKLAKRGQDAAAKWSKTDEGYKFRRSQAEKVLYKYHDQLVRTKVGKVCEFCGNSFEVIKICESSSRFCSNNCKSAQRRKDGIDDVIKTCCVCGIDFKINKYSKTITCSRECGRIKVKSKKVLLK